MSILTDWHMELINNEFEKLFEKLEIFYQNDMQLRNEIHELKRKILELEIHNSNRMGDF